METVQRMHLDMQHNQVLMEIQKGSKGYIQITQFICNVKISTSLVDKGRI